MATERSLISPPKDTFLEMVGAWRYGLVSDGEFYADLTNPRQGTTEFLPGRVSRMTFSREQHSSFLSVEQGELEVFARIALRGAGSDADAAIKFIPVTDLNKVPDDMALLKQPEQFSKFMRHKLATLPVGRTTYNPPV